MKKQAIALLVHQHKEQVNRLISLLSNDFDIYIHIDQKSDLSCEDINNANTWKKINVKWGSYDMVDATVFLYKKILEAGHPYTHIILLSGDSLPVKSNQFIKDFLEKNSSVSFLENHKAEGHTKKRRELWWFNEDLRNSRATPFIYRFIRLTQRKLRLFRSVKGFERTGSQWTILSLDHVRHLLNHCPFKEYRSMAIPDESFVQNHFSNFNLPYSDNLIYANWPVLRSHSPQVIDRSTYLELQKNSYLFARKFEYSFEVNPL